MRYKRSRKHKERKVHSKKLVVVSFSALLSLFGNSLATAGTYDDIRELVGKNRVNEQFSNAERNQIVLEYTRIEQHNRVAQMFAEGKSIDVTSAVEKERQDLMKHIEDDKKKLLDYFTSGALPDDVMVVKTGLDNLLFTESGLKKTSPEEDLKFIPNIWADKYKQVISNVSQVSNFAELGDIGVSLKSPILGGSFIITSPFGMRVNPFDSTLNTMHYGLDLAAIKGQKIIAAWTGTVSAVYTSVNGGNTIEITHDKGLVTRYLHLSEMYVTVGQKVSQYDIIGAAGDTGEVTGPHLHFEVNLDGTPINPLYMFGATGVNALRDYLRTNKDPMYEELVALIPQVKDKPKNMDEIVVSPVKKLNEVDYVKTGDIPDGSIPLTLPNGYAKPNPSTKIVK